MNLGPELLNKVAGFNKRLTRWASKVPELLSRARTFVRPGKATVLSGGPRRKKNTPTTKLLLFFSWTAAVLSAVLANYIFLFEEVTTKALAKAVLTIIGGLIAAAVLRAFANINQLVFDINCHLSNSLQTPHKNHQDAADQCRQVERRDPGSRATIGKSSGYGE